MIRFSLALFVLLLGTLPAAAQSIPPNERPLYGGSKQDEQKFIDSVIASGYTRKAGAQEAVARGFQSFEKRDFGPAMRRFNQAWVLDPDYAETYRGFALVLIARDRKPEEAEAMFKKGASLPDASAGLLADYGRYLVVTKRIPEAIPILERGAAAEGEQADQINAQRLLADAYYDEKQFDKACPLAKKIIDKVEEGRAKESMQFIVTSPRCEG